jgi:dTDP-4-dehydrorhamnose reductase
VRALIVYSEPALQSALTSQWQQRSFSACCTAQQDLAASLAEQLAASDDDEQCLVIDCASRELTADGRPLFSDDLFRQLVDGCRARRAQLLLLSDSRVFPGGKQRYRETDAAQPPSSAGLHLFNREQYLRDQLREHIVLRTGPLIAASGNNLLTDLLQRFRHGGTVAVSTAPRFCPTPVADIARVLSAIYQQLDCAAQCWGTYHYHSSDAASSYEFAEVLLAAAAQYWDVGGGHTQLLTAVAEPSSGIFPTLNCQHIRDTFGIQQLPWRKAIPQLLKTIYAGQSS